MVTCGDVARERVVGGDQIRNDVGDVATIQQSREHFGRIAEDSYGQWFSGALRLPRAPTAPSRSSIRSSR